MDLCQPLNQRCRKFLCALLAGLAVFLSTRLYGQTTIVVNPVKDNTLYESATGNLSNGIGENFFTGRTNVGTNPDFLKRRGLLKFDISANVPAGASVTSVSLILNMNKSSVITAFATTVHKVNADWGEGNSNALAQEGQGIAPQANDATWIHRFFNSSNWTTAGGDFTSTPSASVNVGNLGDYTWTSAQLVADVQSWLDNPSLNFGWIILGNESSGHTAKRFASRENLSTASRPRLSITYTLPCINPVITSFTALPTSICSGDPSTLTVTGNLNSATTWNLYTTGCGTTPVVSNATGVFSVAPSSTTVYYVRGEGGCVTPVVCENLTLTLIPDDDPSFSYSAASYCQNDPDPLPTITGTGGGTFSSSPPGLVINGTSGQIDISSSALGDYSVTYLTPGTCLASLSVPVSIITAYSTSSTETICNGESFVFGTQTLTVAGNYSEVFQSISGCDSTVMLALVVNPVYNETETASICNGYSYLFGTNHLTVAGIYTEVFQSVAGCDSTVVLTLSVNPVFNEAETAVICQGESYTLGTQLLTLPGDYTQIFQSVSGCDSTVVLSLTVHPTFLVPVGAAICSGESYVLGSQTLTVTGTYTENFQSVNSCDSTVVLNLSVHPVFNQPATATICNGDTLQFGPQILTMTGMYTEVFQSINGCDSTVVLTLSLNPVFSGSTTATICQGESFVFGSQTLTTPGEYIEVFQSVDGCDSTMVLTLSVNSANTAVTQNGETLTAQAAGALYQWVDCDLGNAPISNETGQSFTPLVNGRYAVQVTQNGCMGISSCFEVIVVGLENDFTSEISVFPNPVRDKFRVDLSKRYSGIFTEWMDGRGQLRSKKSFYDLQTFELDLSDQNPGLYFLLVRDELGRKAVLKIIKE